VRVNTESLRDLSKQINRAVEGGFVRDRSEYGIAQEEARKGKSAAGPGLPAATSGSGGETDLERAIRDLASAIRTAGGGNGEQPRREPRLVVGGQSPTAVASTNVTRVERGADRRLAEAEAALRMVDSAIANNERLSDARVRAALKSTSGRYQAHVRDERQTRAVGGGPQLRGDQTSFSDDLFDDGTDPESLRRALQERINVRRNLLSRRQQSQRSSGGAADLGMPLGGTSALALDVSLLDKAFERGAKRLADVMSEAIKTTTLKLLDAVRHAQVGPGTPGSPDTGEHRGSTVSEADVEYYEQVMRPSAAGTAKPILQTQRANLVYEWEQRQRERTMTGDEIAKQQDVVSKLETQVKDTGTGRGALFDAQDKLAKLKDRESKSARRVQELEVKIHDLSGRIAVTPDGDDLLSSKQLEQGVQVMREAPSSHEANAHRTMSRWVGNLDTEKRSLWDKAARAGVVGLPEVPAGWNVPRVRGGAVIEQLRAEVGELDRERAVVGRELQEGRRPAMRPGVDVNTASVEELQQVRGIGPALAQRIIDDRTAAGPYGGFEDLTRVKGVSAGLLSKIQPQITLTGMTSPIPAEVDPERQKELTDRYSNLTAQIASRHRSIEEARILSLNQLVEPSAKAYETVVGDKLAAGEISPGQYKDKMGALEHSMERRRSLMGESPDIDRHMVLLPQALANYFRQMIDKYIAALNTYGTATGEFVEPAKAELGKLHAELKQNPLLSAVIGKPVTSQEQALPVAEQINVGFQKDFRKAKTSAELSFGRSLMHGVPRIHPDPNVDTIPIWDEEDGGETRPAPEKRKVREAILHSFRERGGRFAPQTEERRAWVSDTLLRYQKRFQESPDDMTPSNKKMVEGLFEEHELGGKYYYEGAISPPRGVVGGALLAPQEASRVKAGGLRSRLLEGVGVGYEGVKGALTTEGTSGPAQGTPEMIKQLQEVEGSMAAIIRGFGEMSTIKLDPIIEEVKRLGAELKPYAESLQQVHAAFETHYTAKGLAKERALARVREEEKTTGAAERATWLEDSGLGPGMTSSVRIPLGSKFSAHPGKRVAEQLSPAQAALQEVEAELRDAVGDSNRIVNERDILLERKRQAQIAKDPKRARKGVDRGPVPTPEEEAETERRLAELDLEAKASAARTRELSKRRNVLRSQVKTTGGLAQGTGEGVYAQSPVPPQTTDPAQLRKLLGSDARQLAGTSNRLDYLLHLEQTRAAAGQDTKGTNLQVQNAQAEYNARMLGFATRAKSMVEQDPHFWGKDSVAVAQASSAYIETTNRQILLGDSIRKLEDIRGSTETLEQEAATLRKTANALPVDKREPTQRRLGHVEKQLGRLREAGDETWKELRLAGVVQEQDPNSLTVLKGKHGELTKEISSHAQELNKVTKATLEADKAGGGWLDRLGKKFQNLSAYVMAGGVIYTIAAQLRSAANEAISLEADMARIRGILPTRSVGQARAILSGTFQSAYDLAMPVRESLKASRLFTQTGMAPAEAVEMARASLSGQQGAGIEAQQATELLIATRNITAGNVKPFEILDRLSRIESTRAINAQDLSNSIKRAGSLATQLQPQALGAIDAMDLVIGSATTIVERTRVSGEQSATALRFIISRLAAPEVARALQNRFDIPLAGDTPNTLRPLQDIIEDVSKKFKELRASGDTVQAQQLLATFAGARQSNVAAALLAGFDDALRTAAVSAYAFGDTQERVALQLDTVRASFTRFNTAFIGFANALFSDAGLGAVLKVALSAGGGILQAASSPGSALALAVGAGTVGVGSRAASSWLGGQAIRLEREGYESPRMAATARVGAGALGRVAGAGQAIAIGAAVMALAQFGVGTFKRWQEERDLKSGPDFDPTFFRGTPFYQDYQQRSLQFGGKSTNEMYELLTGVVSRVGGQVNEEIASGQLKENQRYTRSTQLLVAALDTALPGFATLGDEATKTSYALSLLKDSAKYGLAVPQTVIDGYLKDVDNAFSGLEDTVPNLAERLRNLPGSDRASVNRQIVAGAVGLDSRSTNVSPARVITELNNLMVSPLWRRSMVDVGKLDVGGGTTIRQVVESASAAGVDPVRALDSYASANLLLGQKDLDSFAAAERVILLKRQEGVNRALTAEEKVITAEERLAVAKDMLRNASEAQVASLTTANRKYENQLRLADQIAEQLEEQLNKQARMGQLTGEGVQDQAGEAFAAGLRQVLALARRRVEERLGDSAQGNAIKAYLDGIQASTSRMKQLADLMSNTAASVRDRMMEPLIQYSMRMADLRGQEMLTERFGVASDPIGVKAEAAKALITGFNQVPVRLLSEILGTSSRVFNQDAAARELGISDAEGPTGAPQADSNVLNVATAVLTDADANRQKADLLFRQYDMLMTQGVGSWLETAQGSSDKQIVELAGKARDALQQMTKLTAITPDDDATTVADKLARAFDLKGTFEEVMQQLLEIVGSQIEAAEARQVNLARNARITAARRQDIQSTAAMEQARIQVGIGRLQTSPTNALDVTRLQLDLLSAQAQTRISLADETRRSALKDIEDQRLPEASRDRIKLIEDAEAQYSRDVSAAEAERQIGSYNLVADKLTQAVRRNEEDVQQLVQSVLDPMRDLLSSPKNMSKEGVGRAVEGLGQAAHQRLLDIFMRRIFSESGVLGETIKNAFNQGAWSTETAIERSNRQAHANLEATYNRAFSNSNRGLYTTIVDAHQAGLAAAVTGVLSQATTAANSAAAAAAAAASAAAAAAAAAASVAGGGTNTPAATPTAAGIAAMPIPDVSHSSTTYMNTGGGGSGVFAIPAALAGLGAAVAGSSRQQDPRSWDEAAFRAWYAEWAQKAEIDPDPDNPLHKYDYRAAFRAGAQPEIDPSDGLYHWPSEFKAEDHPNRYVNGVDTRNSGAEPGAYTAAASALAPAEVSKQFSFTKYGKWGAVADVGLPLAGSLIGGNIRNPNKTYSGEGASIGAMIGGVTPLGPIGAFVGGMVGGWIGGQAKKPDDTERQIAALERIERNTRQQIDAIETQTQMLTLDSRFINVPAGFVVPGFRPAGADGVRDVTVNVYPAPGQNEEKIAQLVAGAIRSELRTTGSSFDIRLD
jgi:competence ComEA-like helix-hairpin-helix protein